MISWEKARKWTGAALDPIIDDLIHERRTAVHMRDEIGAIDVQTGWRGAGAASAQEALKRIRDRSVKHLELVGQLISCTSQAQDGMGEVQNLANEAVSLAEHHGLTITTKGNVSAVGLKAADVDLGRKIEECSEKVTATCKKATEVDSAYKRALAQVAKGKVLHHESFDDATLGLPDIPRKGASSEEVAAWWHALTPEEQNAVIEKEYASIGNLDGIEAWARDKANRKKLEDRLAFLKEEMKSINERREKYPDASDEEILSLDQLNIIKEYKAALAIKRTLNKGGPDTHLYLYEAITNGRGYETPHAAIAVGDVDTANYVSTYVPGMDTSVADSCENMTKTMRNLRDKAENEGSGGNVATIGWIGYDCPTNPLDTGETDVLSTAEAERGGNSLAKHLEGIQDSRNAGIKGKSTVYQTVLGHSYGSTTSSYAMAKVRSDVVDSYFVFGSPGLKSGAWDMNLPENHSYVMRFGDDDIKWGNFIWGSGSGALGKDPMDADSGFQRVTPEDSKTRVTGHSGYLVDGSKAQEQIAKVIVAKGWTL